MALLTPKDKPKKKIIRIGIDDDAYLAIEKYSEWAGFHKLDDFFQQAAQYVINKDKEWKKSDTTERKAKKEEGRKDKD